MFQGLPFGTSGIGNVGSALNLFIILFNMQSVNREICPHCGQTINYHEVALVKTMVQALFRIYIIAKQSGKHEFKRKEIAQVLRSETETARWGDWILFGAGMIYKPTGKGSWGLNMERVNEFLTGKKIIPIRVAKRGQDVKVLEQGTIHAVKGVSQFLDENKQYVVQYLNFEEQGTFI